ncbi:MAG TPA: hypothetical protein VH143_19965 [Kofleriaceae bacterium]|jgi:hypothetical protein|nr:hypothetical protein [Kofleriaceae bacterium]
MRRHVLDLIALGSLGLIAGCPDRAVSEVNTLPQGATTKEIPVSADIDILFVIDNSSSTSDKQALFQMNFTNFVTALDAFPTGRPNLHIGVVTSSVDDGTAAAALSPTGCPSPNTSQNGLLQEGSAVTGRYISDIATAAGSGAPRQTNYSGGDLSAAFASIASVGTGGCGFEAELEAMKRALDGTTNAMNAGFIRPPAYLAVIILTDEDDASIKDGSAGNAVFSLPAASVGGLSDFRVQPMFSYNCDQQITAGSGSAFYTNCVPRTDSYLQDPAYYSSFLASVKDPARTVVAIIAAPPPPPFLTADNPPQAANITYGAGANTIGIGSVTFTSESQTQNPALLPSCSTTLADGAAIGRPAVRLAAFLSAYGDRGKFYNICQPNYGDALTDIGNTLFNAISPCLEGTLDTRDSDPNDPGVQLQCTVNDVLNIGGSDQTETLMPACKMTNSANGAAMCNTAPCPDPSQTLPCWWSDNNPSGCPAPDTGYEINFYRSTPAASGTTESVQCAVGSAG